MLNGLFSGDKDTKPAPKVDNKLRKDWNDFLDHLDKKGFRGKEELDYGEMGNKLLDEYLATNKTTSITKDKVPVIRKELFNYRNWVLDQAKQGKTQLEEGVTEENFMRHIVENEASEKPDYVGSRFTKTKFPDAYLKTFVDGQMVKKENTGFATINK